MGYNLLQLKPGASRSAHLLVAAIVWSGVGLLLLVRGSVWLYGVGQLWIVLPAIFIGTMKALYMLDRAANKNITRIVTGENGKCIGAVYSWKTWLLVFLMMGMGYLLRHSTLPKGLLGLLYVSIGWGLLFASRKSWIAWNLESKKVA